MDSRFASERLAAQARELFAHLPEGEIREHEQLNVGTDAEWNLVLVRTPSATYRLREDAAWRVRPVPEGHEVVAWHAGEELGRTVVSSGAEEALFEGGPPELN